MKNIEKEDLFLSCRPFRTLKIALSLCQFIFFSFKDGSNNTIHVHPEYILILSYIHILLISLKKNIHWKRVRVIYRQEKMWVYKLPLYNIITCNIFPLIQKFIIKFAFFYDSHLIVSDSMSCMKLSLPFQYLAYSHSFRQGSESQHTNSGLKNQFWKCG